MCNIDSISYSLEEATAVAKPAQQKYIKKPVVNEVVVLLQNIMILDIT